MSEPMSEAQLTEIAARLTAYEAEDSRRSHQWAEEYAGDFAADIRELVAEVRRLQAALAILDPSVVKPILGPIVFGESLQ